MLGQPVSMLMPQVVGFKLTGQLPEGATATDLVLTVTEMLRRSGVVGKFVEFFGDGLATLPLADRATIANMAPEYGATCGFFPVDDETLHYLRLTGRTRRAGRARRGVLQGAGPVLARRRRTEPMYTRHARARPRDGRAEPRRAERPQDRVALADAKNVVPRSARGVRRSRTATPDEQVAETFPRATRPRAAPGARRHRRGRGAGRHRRSASRSAPSRCR